MVSPRKREGLLATTRPATRMAVTSPAMWKRDHSAVSPLPSSMKRASRTSGVARSVERSARPAVVFVMNDLRAPPISRRVGEREGPDREHQPHEEEQQEEGALAPAHERGRHQGDHGHGVGGGQEGEVLGVADGGRRPGAEVVGAVEVPVPEAPDDVGRVRRGRRRGDGLRVLEDVDAVGRLDLEAGHPPEAGPQREHADAQRRCRRRGAMSTPSGPPRHRGSRGAGATPT